MALIEGQSLAAASHKDASLSNKVPGSSQSLPKLWITLTAWESVTEMSSLLIYVYDNNSYVYLIDFGIAYVPGSGEVSSPPGTIRGTPAYLAPEQVQGGKLEILPASDQYSLGSVFYEALCGKPPFCGPPSFVLFHSIHHEPPCPRTIDSRIPKRLAAICRKAMAKQPDQRFSSCRELANALWTWLGSSERAGHGR